MVPEGRTELLLVRHGESIWNAERRWAGHADPELSSRGVDEAKAAARSHLADLGLQAVSSSPMRRARGTAELICAQLGLPLTALISNLRERPAGEWSGLTSAEIERRYPGLLNAWRAGDSIEIPAGEPWEAFKRRVIAGIREAAGEAEGRRLLIVTHGGVLRAVCDYLAEAPGVWPNLGGRWLGSKGNTLSGGPRHPA